MNTERLTELTKVSEYILKVLRLVVGVDVNEYTIPLLNKTISDYTAQETQSLQAELEQLKKENEDMDNALVTIGESYEKLKLAADKLAKAIEWSLNIKQLWEAHGEITPSTFNELAALTKMQSDLEQALTEYKELTK